MSVGGVLGNGVKVGFSANSPMSYTTVAQLLDVVVPNLVADRIEKTTHGSAGYKSYMSGLKDVSPMEITVLSDWDKTTTPSHNALLILSKTKAIVWWRIEIPASRDLSTTLYQRILFQGSVSQFTPATPIADKQTFKVSVQFEGTDIEIGDGPSAGVLT